MNVKATTRSPLWLVIPMVYLLWRVLAHIVQTYAVLTMPWIGLPNEEGLFISMQLISGAMFFVGTLYVLYLYVTQKRLFPKAFTVLISLLLVYNVCEALLRATFGDRLENSDMTPFRNLFLGGIIWIPYVLRSRRVLSFFVKP